MRKMLYISACLTYDDISVSFPDCSGSITRHYFNIYKIINDKAGIIYDK